MDYNIVITKDTEEDLDGFIKYLILKRASAFPSGYSLTICISSEDNAAIQEI